MTWSRQSGEGTCSATVVAGGGGSARRRQHAAKTGPDLLDRIAYAPAGATGALGASDYSTLALRSGMRPAVMNTYAENARRRPQGYHPATRYSGGWLADKAIIPASERGHVECTSAILLGAA